MKKLKNKVNLFLVESPFQLLSAIEANNYFKNEKNILIIKYFNNKVNSKNNHQMKLLKDFISWEFIIEINCNVLNIESDIKLLFYIRKFVKTYDIDKIFIGEYRSWYMRQYFNVLKANRCFVLDDGNITLELAKSYLSTGKDYNFSNTWKRQLKRFFNYVIIFFINNCTIPKKRVDIDLFTCFNVVQYSDKQLLINHSFEFLKKKNKVKSSLQNVVYFIGGRLSEANAMTEEDEFFELKKVKKYFDERKIKIVYIPHRRESINKLNLFKKELNIEIKHFEYPAEIEFIQMEELPCYLASYMSTALYTVSKMIDFNEVISFQLTLNKINKIYLEDIITTYEEYKKTMKVIDLNDIN